MRTLGTMLLVLAGSLPHASHLCAAPEADTSLIEVREAYKTGDYEDVIVLADQALLEATRSGDPAGAVPELHFWRGASLRRLGRLKEALVALENAKRYGMDEPELYLEEALTHRELGEQGAADRAYDNVERTMPKDLDRQARIAARWKEMELEEPTFQFWITPTVGVDTNVLGVDEDAPLAGGTMDQESFYAGMGLYMKVNVHKKEREVLSFDYRNELRWYEEEPDLSYTDNYLGGYGKIPLLDPIDVELRATYGEAFTDGDGHLRTTHSVGPAFLLYLAEDVEARIWGDWTHADYYQSNAPPAENRDGDIARAGVALGIGLGDGWSVAPGASFTRYSAEGDDFDYDAVTASLSLVTPRIAGAVYAVDVSYTIADYDNPNSLSALSERREDEILRVSLRIRLRVLEDSVGYAPTLSIGYADHSSNVDAYDYDRWIPQMELGILAYSF